MHIAADLIHPGQVHRERVLGRGVVGLVSLSGLVEAPPERLVLRRLPDRQAVVIALEPAGGLEWVWP